MAMIFEVEYPDGERVHAVGYPGGQLRVLEVPRGPTAAYLDELEVDFTSQPVRVLRILAGPRLPTQHVRLDGASEPEREAWMADREAEGWVTRESPGDPHEIWMAPERPNLDPDRPICLAREFRARLRRT